MRSARLTIARSRCPVPCRHSNGSMPQKFPWRQRWQDSLEHLFAPTAGGLHQFRLLTGGQNFFRKYRYFTHSHDGSADGSMWDYKLVPVPRMATRKHSRRLMPFDYMLFAGVEKSSQFPPSFHRLMSSVQTLFFATWLILAWEYAETWGHWDVHDMADGVSCHPRVTRADMISEEDFFHPGVKAIRWELGHASEPNGIYNKETQGNHLWTATASMRANAFPHVLGRPTQVRHLHQNTKWGPMLPDTD
eukprot:TRINITY_DN356_c0_g1_i1.p3 TRINITY_DN356_c0_g1~~TRINITY_DN356_c0_g1_i1.p3  ORF type:complete len:247 (-),score=20.69 TRINITY_DN356_c0_g1_i1:646-1386(-)